MNEPTKFVAESMVAAIKSYFARALAPTAARVEELEKRIAALEELLAEKRKSLALIK